MHHLCLHLWSILSIVGINTINNIIIIIIFNETLLSSMIVLTVQYYSPWQVIFNEYVKEQLCNSFMTRFISNMVTYTATQATQQRCNTWSVQVWITHDTQYDYCDQQVLQRCDVLVTRYILIILLDKCERELSAMVLWL